MSFGATMRELRDGEIVVGSGAEADWRVTTADLMPRHFVLTVHGLNTAVRPCSADVVAAVNDKQITGIYHLLNDGDVVSAGRGRFIYADESPRVEGVEPANGETGFLVDDGSRTAFPLVNRSTAIGRDVSNAVVISDPRASRFHGEIRREAGGFALHSMGSSGTRLNGALMNGPRLLTEADTIEIAYTTLRFSFTPPGDGVRVVQPNLGLNDDAASRPTMLRDRVTMESAVATTEHPDAYAWAKLAAALAAITAFAWLAWWLMHR